MRIRILLVSIFGTQYQRKLVNVFDLNFKPRFTKKIQVFSFDSFENKALTQLKLKVANKALK